MASLTTQEQALLREMARLAGTDRVVTGPRVARLGFADFVATTYGAVVAYPQSLQSRKLQILRDRGTSGWRDTMEALTRFSNKRTPNHALQRTRPSRCGCNPRVPWAGSLSLGR